MVPNVFDTLKFYCISTNLYTLYKRYFAVADLLTVSSGFQVVLLFPTFPTVWFKQYFIHRKYIHVSTLHNGTGSDSKQSAYI